MRTALAVTSLLLLAAVSMATHWGGPISWETDALFYQAKSEEISGTDGATARRQVFGGPLSEYERGLEAEAPDEPPRVSDPAWVEYSSDFYARRLFLPALAVALDPLFGLHSLQVLSLLGFVFIPALLFLLLRRRLSFAVSLGVAAAVILWPPLRAWSVFPLTDSSGLALLIAALLCALLAIERSRRWLAPWFACVLALAFTRDIAFIPVIAALGLLAVRRDRPTLALFGVGVARRPAGALRARRLGVESARLRLRQPHDPHRHQLGLRCSPSTPPTSATYSVATATTRWVIRSSCWPQSAASSPPLLWRRAATR